MDISSKYEDESEQSEFEDEEEPEEVNSQEIFANHIVKKRKKE